MSRVLCAALVCFLVGGSASLPASQPVYQPQYIQAQAVPITARAQTQAYQPQYLQRAKPVFEPNKPEGLQYYASQRQQQPIQQVLLPTNVDRQIQKAAEPGGSLYLSQILAAQQAGQAQDALAAAQRKQTSQTFARGIQPVPVQYPKPTENYPAQYVRPAAQPQYAPQPQYTPQAGPARGRTEDETDYDPNPSYQFGFDVKDDLYTNYQNRKEQRDGNKITGSYSVVDSDGFIRTVQYTADPKEGFKAEVTRQPTDIVVKIPKPDPRFQQEAPRPQQQYIQAQQPVYRGQESQEQKNVAYRYQ